MNSKEIYEIFKLGSEYDCIDIQIQSMTAWGKEGKKLSLNKKDMKVFQTNVNKIKEFADEKKISTNIEFYRDDRLIQDINNMDKILKEERTKNNPWLNLPCFEPWYNMIILPNGTVAPCSISGGIGGEIIKNKTLKEVWFGEMFIKLRKNLLENNLPDYCKKCCIALHLENRRIKEELRKY